MARLSLHFPEDQYCYQTQLTVRVTDINGANHLGNDSMISMISEARARFLFEFGITEAASDGVGIIVTDLATTYKAEAHARDQLLFEVGVMDFNTYGGDITFRISRPADGTLVAMAKSGFVFFNYPKQPGHPHARGLPQQVPPGQLAQLTHSRQPPQSLAPTRRNGQRARPFSARAASPIGLQRPISGACTDLAQLLQIPPQR